MAEGSVASSSLQEPSQPLDIAAVPRTGPNWDAFGQKGSLRTSWSPLMWTRAVFTAVCDRQCGVNVSEHFNSPRQVRSASCLLLQVPERCFSAFLKKCSQPHVSQSICLEWQLYLPCWNNFVCRALQRPAGRESSLGGTKRSSTLEFGP